MNKFTSSLILLFITTVSLFTACKKNSSSPEKTDVPSPALEPTVNYTIDPKSTDKFARAFTFKGTATNYKTAEWDFGDTKTSTDLTIEHNYTNYGTYKVVFTATDLAGKTAKKETLLIVANPSKWNLYANKGQTSLKDYYYNKPDNYYNETQTNTGFNYWWNAHALDVLVDAYNRTKDPKYLTQMKNLLLGSYNKNGSKYKNNFYDDMEWWGLSCLRAYDATKDMVYKNTALELWGYIKQGWTEVKNGGIMWEVNSPNSKNACSNAPAAILAARLYQLDKNQNDLNWAIKIYDWQKQYLVNPSTGLVWDSYDNHNEGWRFTYNQGTYIGASQELYTITKDVKYLNEAKLTATSVVTDPFFSTNGILKGGTGDGGLFKGIFIRYLVQLMIKGNLDATTKDTYAAYLVKNAESLIDHGTSSAEGFYSPDWRTMPQPDQRQTSVQLSGIMLFEGIHELWLLDIIK